MLEKKDPLVSIILPAYNVEKYLGKAIDSILQQTFTDFEFIIIDDGSTDGTEKILKNYSDPRIVYLKHEANMGLVYTLNHCISLARGIYIGRMDGDDISLPDRIQKQFEYLQIKQDVDVLATQVRLIDEDGNAIGFWDDDIKYSSVKS